VGIKKLSGVISAVPRILQPYWEIVLVESLGNKFWIATYKLLPHVFEELKED
jgi:hypothetical protein